MEEVAVEEVKFVQLTGEMEPLMEKVRHTLYVIRYTLYVIRLYQH